MGAGDLTALQRAPPQGCAHLLLGGGAGGWWQRLQEVGRAPQHVVTSLQVLPWGDSMEVCPDPGPVAPQMP